MEDYGSRFIPGRYFAAVVTWRSNLRQQGSLWYCKLTCSADYPLKSQFAKGQRIHRALTTVDSPFSDRGRFTANQVTGITQIAGQ